MVKKNVGIWQYLRLRVYGLGGWCNNYVLSKLHEEWEIKKVFFNAAHCQNFVLEKNTPP